MNSFVLNVADFNLAYTLECGQVFRWHRITPDKYEGVVDNAILRIHQKGSRLFIETSSSKIGPAFIKSYFDLTLDLPYIYNKIGKDKHIKAAIGKFRGLRIVRQPLWECLASFIISAYNNIPRIKKIIFALSRCSGRPMALNGVIDYSFPMPQVIADFSLVRLKKCGAGFRAPYLRKTAEAFLKNRLDIGLLKQMPYEKAKKLLMQLDGVGQKVADCVLLYSVGKFEAFPVDVWVKRIMEKLYFKGRRMSEKKIRGEAMLRFGPYAGYAQQYLFHHGRTVGYK